MLAVLYHGTGQAAGPDSYNYSDSYDSCSDSYVSVLRELLVARVQVSVKLQNYNQRSNLQICNSVS